MITAFLKTNSLPNLNRQLTVTVRTTLVVLRFFEWGECISFKDRYFRVAQVSVNKALRIPMRAFFVRQTASENVGREK